MIIKVADLKKADVTSQQGDKLSKIKHILYDPSEKRVIAFLTSEPNLMTDAKLIQMENIEEMSSNAIIVDTKDAEKKASSIGDAVSKLSKDTKLRLNKGKIISDDATEFGDVSDVFIESDTGQVIGFEVSQGKVKDIPEGKKTMKITEIVSVGEDAIVVKPKLANGSENNKEVSGLDEPDPKIVQDAVGKYLAKNILTSDDQLFAKQGDIITNEMMQAAYTNGLLEQVIQNVTTNVD